MACTYAWQSVFRPGDSEDFFMDDHPPHFCANTDSVHPVTAWWLSELSRLICRRDISEGIAQPGRASRNDFLARVIVTELSPAGPWFRFTRAGTVVRNGEAAGDHSHCFQAPSFLANRAPLNHTAQLPDVFSMWRADDRSRETNNAVVTIASAGGRK